MMSKLIFVVVCCLCLTYTSAQTQITNHFMGFICKTACSYCHLRSLFENTWCQLCRCNENLANRMGSSPCASSPCGEGMTCEVVTISGWLPRTYATCVQQSTTAPTTTSTTTTTTTTPATTPVERVCNSNEDCVGNEVCVVSPGQPGTCQLILQRTVGEKCLEEMVVGPCRAGFTRFFYNTTSQTCQGFRYGGCNGNGNRFDSMESCKKECVEVKTVFDETGSQANEIKEVEGEKAKEENRCSLPHHLGTCRALMNRYYYNSETGKCDLFKYGGCGGNKNNFMTKEECETTCVSSV